MQSSSIKNTAVLLGLLESGRCYWRLWSLILWGGVLAVVMGFSITIGAIQATFEEMPGMPYRLLSDGIWFAPLYTLLSLLIITDVRSRVLARGSLAAFLLLPLAERTKQQLLLLRSAVLPFVFLSIGGFSVLGLWFPQLLADAAVLFPSSAAAAVCLGLLGWSGNWSYLSGKMLFSHVSYRVGSRKYQLYTLIGTAGLLMTAFVSGVWLLVLTCLFVIAMVHVYLSPVFSLQIQGQSAYTTHEPGRDLARQGVTERWIVRIPGMRALTGSRIWRVLKLVSMSNHFSLESQQNPSRSFLQEILGWCVMGIVCTASWVFLYYSHSQLQGTIVGTVSALVIGWFSFIYARTAVPLLYTLPLQLHERLFERLFRSCVIPFFILLLGVPVTVLILRGLTGVFGILGATWFAAQSPQPAVWVLVVNALRSGLRALPLMLSASMALQAVFCAVGMVLQGLRAHKAARGALHSYGIAFFLGIGIVVNLVDSSRTHAVLQNTPLIYSLAILVLTAGVYLICWAWVDARQQRGMT